jgi:hypothetical protein
LVRKRTFHYLVPELKKELSSKDKESISLRYGLLSEYVNKKTLWMKKKELKSPNISTK